MLDGQFPDNVTQLIELPGIGRSTAGAISSIAFKNQASILDGNVKRVLARFSATEGWPGKREVVEKLWLIAETFTPMDRIADYTQAMMDLGATLCTRSSPSCSECPLMSNCIAYKQGNPKDYPGKKAKKKVPVKTAYFLMLSNEQGEFLLEQNPPVGLWGGLWIFPQCETEAELPNLYSRLGVEPDSQEILEVKRHTFSHFHLDYQPVHAAVASIAVSESKVAEGANQVWYNPQKPLSLGMPAPIKALFANIA